MKLKLFLRYIKAGILIHLNYYNWRIFYTSYGFAVECKKRDIKPILFNNEKDLLAFLYNQKKVAENANI